MPIPPLVPKLEFINLAEVAALFEGVGPVQGGIASFGAPAAYALVWEFGSKRMKQPGPKTMWSTNPLGDEAILTKQAPLGYIHIHEKEVWPIVRQEFSKINFSKVRSARDIELRLEIAMDNAMQRVARIVSDSAPVDEGDLRASIQYVDSDDIGYTDVGDSGAAEGIGSFML